ncbi:MAG: AAA family ATPase [Erythrobacter sp.]|nr:AAA family ATPase [Erythrobacter sp.]
MMPARVPAKLPEGKSVRMPKPAKSATASPAPTIVEPAATPIATAQPSTPAPVPAKPVDDDVPAARLPRDTKSIDRENLRKQGFVNPDAGASALREEFRIVKRQVLASAQADGSPLSRRVLICSPHTGEGKTFCAVNLALSMASERDIEVVLIDADFAKPSIMATFGLERASGTKQGFMNALKDDTIRPEELVVATDVPGLFLMPAGERTGSDAEYLASERTAKVLDRLTRGAKNRILIFDSPPALAASPAAELAKHVGQALLVARADATARAALEDAVDLLSACPDIRLILNDATFSPSGRKFGSYYGYGE